MNVQLAPDVARLLEPLTSTSEYRTDEVVNQTLRIWFSLMELCSCDAQADAVFVQLIVHAAALTLRHEDDDVTALNLEDQLGAQRQP